MGTNCMLEGIYKDLGAVRCGHLSETSSYLWVLFTLSASLLIWDYNWANTTMTSADFL